MSVRLATGHLATGHLATSDLARLLGDRDGILCFGGEDWWYHNNAHFDMQLMKCFARSVPVLYVNSIGMRVPRLSEGRVFAGRVARKLKSIARCVRNPREKLFVASPLSWPAWNRPLLRALNVRSVALQVRAMARWAGLRRPVIWVAVPTAREIVEQLRGDAPVVYQRTDKYEEFAHATRDYVMACDRELAGTADLVLYASSALHEEGRHDNRAAMLVGHAVEPERFDPDRALAAPEPDDLRGIRRPIVGFFGGIDDHTVDVALVGQAARAVPEASFVLVGRRSADPAPVAGLPNVFFLGKKEYEEIPRYGARFDVAIMPWNRNRWIHYCNPIKLKEYLALGVPVVSTDFPEVRRFADVIRVAKDTDDFVDGIREALAGRPAGDPARRRARVAGDTWDGAMQRVAAEIRRVAEARATGWAPRARPPLRVAMAVHAYYEKDARVRRYAEALAAEGHEVDVIALRDPATPREETLCGVRVVRVPLQRRRGGVLRYLFEYAAFFVLTAWTLLTRHLRRPYRLVHVHNMPDFLAFAALPLRMLGARVILDVHDLMPEVWASKFKVAPGHPAIWPLRLQEWLSQRFACRVIYATDIFRQIAIMRGCAADRRTTSVLNAADLRIFDRRRHPWTGPADRREFRVLYLGTISDRHGVDQAVRAVARLRDRIPGIKFTIHPRFADGEGKPLADLERIVAEEKLAGIVEFLPPVPLEQVPAAMARADVGVFTPHLDVHIDIALSLKVPEFVAMQVPIVTTRTRIMRGLFRDDEVAYFDDGDIDGCAAAIQRIHDHPEGARAMAARADRFLAEHSWDQEKARYFALIDGLCPDAAPVARPRVTGTGGTAPAAAATEPALRRPEPVAR